MKRRYRENHPEACIARDLLKRALKLTGKRKEEITQKALGYGFKELRTNIENKFSAGMNWNNWGEWEVDHIKPVCIFIDEKIYDPKIINALSNLRPLWAEENRARTRRRWENDNCTN